MHTHNTQRCICCCRISPIKATSMWIMATKQSSEVGKACCQPGKKSMDDGMQWMMELDQTSPFKRLTESQYLLSKAGHWEEGGRLRPLSQPGWQKMLLPRCGGASAVLSNDHSRPRLLPTKKRDLNRSADIFPSIFCFVFVDFDLSKKRQKTIGGDFCH